jgi:hypothetical protein
MPFDVSWYLEKRVLYVRVSGIIRDDEIKPFDDVMLRYIEQGEGQLVHAISDFRAAEKMPAIRTMVRKLSFPSHPQFGWTAFFGFRSPILIMTLSVVPQVFKARFRHLSSLDQALNFLPQVDDTLPDLHQFKDRLAPTE